MEGSKSCVNNEKKIYQENASNLKFMSDSHLSSLQISYSSCEGGAGASRPRSYREVSFEVSDLSGKKLEDQSGLEENLHEEEKYENNINNCFSSLAFSSKVFCKYCGIETNSLVDYEFSYKHWLRSMFFKIKCCAEQKSDEFVIVHRCKKCREILAKIYTAQL